MVIFVKNQDYINSLVECIINFNVLSSAKNNWGKSEAISFGAELVKKTVLPNWLSWVKGGFKYLGVFLGDYSFVCRNWDNVLEKIEGRLKKWKWILPHMSFKGRVLVINNLASSMLWHRLMCVDPLPQLLAKIQAVLVNFFLGSFTLGPPMSFIFAKGRRTNSSGLQRCYFQTPVYTETACWTRKPYLETCGPCYIEPRWKFGSRSVIVFNGSEDSQTM